MTRRTAALTHAHDSGEPARGEEENLIRYAWGRGDAVSVSLPHCPDQRLVIPSPLVPAESPI